MLCIQRHSYANGDNVMKPMTMLSNWSQCCDDMAVNMNLMRNFRSRKGMYSWPLESLDKRLAKLLPASALVGPTNTKCIQVHVFTKFYFALFWSLLLLQWGVTGKGSGEPKEVDLSVGGWDLDLTSSRGAKDATRNKGHRYQEQRTSWPYC